MQEGKDKATLGSIMTMEETHERLRPGWKKHRLAIGVGLLAIGVGSLWWQRAPLATHFIDRELSRRGVPASYRIERLTTGGATLADVVIGDPAAPDLVASRLTVNLRWGFGWANIGAINIENALLRGRLDNKGLSFGSIDRLRPKPSGEPFALPDFDLRLENTRLMLATPGGVVGVAAEGAGNLTDGFAARAAASIPRWSSPDCELSGGRARVDLMIVKRSIKLSGRARTSALVCGQFRSGRGAAFVTASLPETLTSAEGRMDLAVRRLGYDGGVVDQTMFKGGFNYASPDNVIGLNGVAAWKGLRGPDQLRAAIRQSTASLASLPPGPVAQSIAGAVARATEQSDGSAQVALNMRAGAGRLSVSNLGMRAASGAQITASGRAFSISLQDRVPRLDGRLAVSGGGLPDIGLDVRPLGRGWQMLGSIAPYAAGKARLALSPLRLDWDGAQGRLLVQATMDGPLGDGSVTGLSVPLDLRFAANEAFSLGAGGRCMTLSFRQLDTAGIRMGATRIPVCATKGDVLLAGNAGGRLSGGFGIDQIQLNGTMGDAPVTLSASKVTTAFGGSVAAPDIRFGLGPSAVKMERADGETGLRLAGLAGRSVAGGGFAGEIENAEGQIVNVPLLMDRANGRWFYRTGVLNIDAPSIRVRDAAPAKRFEPVLARDVKLSLENGVVTGDAVIAHPANDKRLALVNLTHDLSSARGKADLDVPRLVFGDDLQPEALTPLTRGIIANVGGAIEGAGQIRWSASGVSSDGSFETDGIGLSAAFGQVHNIKGRIVFDDLLGMTTPPGQIATIGEMNTGVSVKDGVVRYQLLPDQHVKVEEGRWPFAGGDLVLEPTVLDFSRPSDRIFTLTVVGLDAAQFIQQFNFRNFAVTGLFDGRLPLLFNEKGGRIVGGRLIARKPGGTLAYVGEVSEADIGGAGKLAFDALKSLKYNALVIEMDGELDGEIISTVLFNGMNEQPVNPTGSSLPVKATGLPFKFNITIRAPFRSLLNTAESFTDVRTTVRQAAPLPADAVPGAAPVQP